MASHLHPLHAHTETIKFMISDHWFYYTALEHAKVVSSGYQNLYVIHLIKIGHMLPNIRAQNQLYYLFSFLSKIQVYFTI